MINNTFKAFKELEKLQNSMKRMDEHLNNKKIGYEPKCKVCNSKYQEIIERSREEGYTLEDIRDYLEKKGEDISIMSLSRHFDRHYPARRKYIQEIDDKKAQEIEKGEKKIEYIQEHYPEIMEELEGDMTIDYEYNPETDKFKDIKKPARDVFIFDYGYCFEGGKLCTLVPKCELLDSYEVSEDLGIKLNNLIESHESDYLDTKKFKVIKDLTECLECQISFNNSCIRSLLNLFLYDKYGLNIEMDEFYRMAFKEDFIPEDMDKELHKIASQERDKAQNNS